MGFGISAKVFHLPFITTLPAHYELVSILQRKGMKQRHSFQAKIVRTIEELVQDPGIDLIVITTPNDTHFPYTKMALEAGKHVVLEKPFTNTTEERPAAGRNRCCFRENFKRLSEPEIRQ